MVEIIESSRLAIDASSLWAVVSTMDGVNAELAPLLRMSVPSSARGMSLADAPRGEVAFVSWLLAFGVLPFDRHRLCLVEVEAQRRFVERSSSALQRVWEHERTLSPLLGGGTELRDRVRFEARVSALTPVSALVVRRLFRHRHARLRARFGAQ